jgi:hypothetical protein
MAQEGAAKEEHEPMSQGDINDIMEKYRRRLNQELGGETPESAHSKITSLEYEQFKADILPGRHSLYEQACAFSERVLKIAPDQKKVPALLENISTAHLNVTPTGVTSFAILAPLAIAFIGSFLAATLPIIVGGGPSIFFIAFSLLTALALMIPLQRMPSFMANNWRLRASNQMVLCIFYIVTYMRHTSNLELALEFAGSHLSGPLALDLKKVLWDIETEKYSTVKESLDNYLVRWRTYNMEFVEAMHLIESSLYEPAEARRLDLLDKSLDIILEETYEKMLHYAQNLKSPINTLYMLGIILPILSLVILPLAINFIGSVKWYYIAAFYDVALPLGVFMLGISILAQRPTGYGDTDISEMMPELSVYRKMKISFGGKDLFLNPVYFCAAIGGIIFLISLAPIILHLAGFENYGIGKEVEESDCKHAYCVITYVEQTDENENVSKVGPFDLASSIFGLLMPFSIAVAVGLYYRMKSKNLMQIRDDTKKLESEFAAALFQLGNRLGDGLPAEVALEKTAAILEGTQSGRFFQQVTNNIKKMGMSVSDAVFNNKIGAITNFPSRIIESSMKVLVQASKKSPKIAAQALINISRYIKEMHRVNERLQDLLSEVITSMKSQTSFLTPLIAGIVVGLSSMITSILLRLPTMLEQEATTDAGIMSTIPEMFKASIPTYYFQVVVGFYVVEIVYIMTILGNGIENGSDKLNEEHMLGENMLKSVGLYVVVALVVMLILNITAELVLNKGLAGMG